MSQLFVGALEESVSEFLAVRLNRQINAPISWLVWSTSQNDIIASGELSNKAQIAELSPYAEQRTTLLLLDSRDVILTTSEVPVGASRQLESMLPYLLEDDIAQDVEALHFSVLQRSANKAYIAGVDKQYLAGWLSIFEQAGIEVKKVLPDVLAMPYRDEELSALKRDDHWLFRKGLFDGVVVHKLWLQPFLLSNWCQEEDKSMAVTSYSAVAEESESIEQEWKVAEPELVMSLLAKGAIASPVNLLSGAFKPHSSFLKQLKIWRKVAIAASIFILILVSQRLYQVNQYEQQAQNYRSESEKVFRTVFPDKNRIPTVSYLKRQMNDEVTRLSGRSSEESILDWLTRLSRAVEKYPSVEIQSIRYDANRTELRIDTLMDDFQTFEVIRVALAKNYAVVQGPLSKKDNKVSGSFVLRRKQ